MKRFFLLSIPIIFLLVIFVSCNNINDHNVSVSISENEGGYKFSAKYPSKKNKEIQTYIEKCTGNNQLFSNKGNCNTTVTLEDNIQLFIKKTNGKLIIKVENEESESQSYNNIKQIGNGIKQILATN